MPVTEVITIIIKVRYSIEHTIAAILEYLLNLHTEKPDLIVSKYHVTTKARIPGQRPDRLDIIIEVMLKQGWIAETKTEHANYYKITEKGKKAYDQWVKHFLEFARSLKE